jgi:hypothetical protein
MPSCILHVGAPKTGTSSIQGWLHFGLRDPRFHSVHLGYENAVTFLEPLFGDPENFWAFRRIGISGAKLQQLKLTSRRRLRRSLVRARAVGAIPIISAERIWSAPPFMLQQIRDYLHQEGFEVRVIAYVRPLRSYMASAFQQNLKIQSYVPPLNQFLEQIHSTPGFDITARLSLLDRIFGADKLTIRRFAPDGLLDGCVVRDFCSTLGIEFNGAAIVRINDAICADALRMLYSFRRFGRDGFEVPFWKDNWIVMRLERLKGQSFCLHPNLLAPFDHAFATQEQKVLERWGIDLREPPAKADDRAAIGSEADLFCFSRESLDWLARVSGSRPILESEGEATAQAVAAQIEALARRPDPRLKLLFFLKMYRLKWRWLCHGL